MSSHAESSGKLVWLRLLIDRGITLIVNVVLNHHAPSHPPAAFIVSLLALIELVCFEIVESNLELTSPL